MKSRPKEVIDNRCNKKDGTNSKIVPSSSATAHFRRSKTAHYGRPYTLPISPCVRIIIHEFWTAKAATKKFGETFHISKTVYIRIFFFRNLPKSVTCAKTSEHAATYQPFAIEEGSIFSMLQGKAAHSLRSELIVSLCQLLQPKGWSLSKGD